MNSVQLENGQEETTETYADQLHYLGSPGMDDVDDELPLCPRIGDQYQVEIPNIATESERLQLTSHQINTENMLDDNYIFGLGLAVPIMWIHHTGEPIKNELNEFPASKIGGNEANESGFADFGRGKESQIDAKCSIVGEFPAENSSYHDMHPQGSACKVELINDLGDQGKDSGGFTSQESSAANDQMDAGSPWLDQSKAKLFSPLPGSPAPSWIVAEEQSFLLGLYIFGKNLVQVKKFMENKKMGDILSYYYGKFYRSDVHCRWSECKKIRSRKCILGQRIFIGWRQQELLSRVLPTVSKEGQDALLEATKTFTEGRASLEEFVITLKAIVGMEVLVEAIGIGKGKHDLTVVDPVRTNHSVSIRPELPIGKACSSLSSSDIIKFLTGDFRLSKARSNDLFWEAVWPCLLARGWHSEQPKDSSAVSKHALVFLIPGVKKFSRKKLVKGNHYFDSVSDVLSKVASDPRLLELDVEGAEESSSIKDENGWAADNRSDQNGLSKHPRHCYLHPRLLNCSSQLMKFTVVDTSMVQGEGPLRVRELRSLPVDSPYDHSSCSGERGSNSLLEQLDSDDSSSDDQGDSDLNNFLDKKVEQRQSCMIDEGTQSGPSANMVAVSNKRVPINGHVSYDHCAGLTNEKPRITDAKCQFSHRAKSGQKDYLAPMSKRKRLTACRYERTGRRTYSFPRGHQLKKEEIHHDLDSLKANDTRRGEVDQSRGKVPMNPSTNHNPDENSRRAFSGEHYATISVSEMTVSKEKPQPRAFIDLNIPHIPTDYETAEHFSTEVAGSQDYVNPGREACLPETKQQDNGSQVIGTSNVLLDEQPSRNSRRQSTRNRPPTTRALEALACGFLGTKRKGRDTRVPLSGKLTRRPSRRVHRSETSVLVPSSGVSSVSSDMKETNAGTNEWHGGNTNHEIMFNGSYVESERKATHDLVGVP